MTDDMRRVVLSAHDEFVARLRAVLDDEGIIVGFYLPFARSCAGRTLTAKELAKEFDHSLAAYGRYAPLGLAVMLNGKRFLAAVIDDDAVRREALELAYPTGSLFG